MVLLGCFCFLLLMGVVGHFEQEPAVDNRIDDRERMFAQQDEEARARAWLAYCAGRDNAARSYEKAKTKTAANR